MWSNSIPHGVASANPQGVARLSFGGKRQVEIGSIGSLRSDEPSLKDVCCELIMPRVKKHYLVISCTNCKRLLLATADRKTRTCPYCGERVKTEYAPALFQSENPDEARAALREAKVQIKSKVPADSENSR
jgi:RNA polymerase subunit RPABC4/transcription elongation factor Spt4